MARMALALAMVLWVAVGGCGVGEAPFVLEVEVQEVNRFDPLPEGPGMERGVFWRRAKGFLVWRRERFLQPAGEGRWPLYGGGIPRTLPGASFLEPPLAVEEAEGGALWVRAGEVALLLSPGEERRLLFTARGAFLDEDPEGWQEALRAALQGEEPLAVWTLRLREGEAP